MRNPSRDPSCFGVTLRAALNMFCVTLRVTLRVFGVTLRATLDICCVTLRVTLRVFGVTLRT